jgi:F-type H+-transporting ATPase subunit epsilon
MNYFLVDVLTPSKIIAKNVQAESLLIPTSRGQINVLEGHTHLVTKLAPGVLTLFGGPDYGDRNFVITVGVCKILENKITILANTAEESKDVDVERAKLALARAEEKLRHPDTLSIEELEKYTRKVERAKLRIQLGDSARSRN